MVFNLRESGRILYISSVDISIGNGPGVNELEFILGLYKAIGDRAHFLIPKPVENVSGLPPHVCTFTLPHKKHSLRHFPNHVVSQIRQANVILAHNQFDLLVFRLDVLPIAPLFITKKHQMPYALKTLGQGVINVLSEKGKLWQSLSGVNQWLFKQLVNAAIVADSVSVMQVNYLQQVLAIGSNKIVWVDNAVNTNRFVPSSTQTARLELGLINFDPIIGYVGTRPWERGGMQLVEVAPRLLSKYPNLGLVILGDGTELETLKQRACELKIEEHCVFPGYVPFHKVPCYINSLDIGVSISLRSNRRAASELKVRQYLACGKPVVVSPGSNDFLTTSKLGSIVQPTDLETITAELDHWLSLPNKEKLKLAHRASQYAQDCLSIEHALSKRFELWAERLPLQQLG